MAVNSLLPEVDLDFTWDLYSLKTHDLVPSLATSEVMAFMTPARIALIVGVMLLCQIVYTILHRVVGLSGKNAVRIVALLHAIYGTTFPLYIQLSGTHDVFRTITDDYCITVPNVSYLAGISAGFFLWDLYVSVSQNWGFAFVLHGLFCSYLFLLPTMGPFLHHDAVVFDFYEASTIFLNTYQLAFAFGYPRLASLLRYAFAVVFITVRLGFGLYFSWQYQTIFIWGNPNGVNLSCYPKHILVIPPIISCLFYPLNLYWSVGIFQALCKRAKGTKVGYEEADVEPKKQK